MDSGQPSIDQWTPPSRETQWKSLSLRIEQNLAKFARSMGCHPYVEGAHENLDHMYWLIPFARRLESESEFHGLYPYFHHAEIDLRLSSPDRTEPGNYLVIFAPTSGQYRIYMRPSYPSSRRNAPVYVDSEDEAITVLKTLCKRLFDTP